MCLLFGKSLKWIVLKHSNIYVKLIWSTFCNTDLWLAKIITLQFVIKGLTGSPSQMTAHENN